MSSSRDENPPPADSGHFTSARTLGQAFQAAGEDFAELVRAGVRSHETWLMHEANLARLLEHLPCGINTPIASLDEDVLLSLAQAERRGRRTMKDGTVPEVSNGTLRKRFSTLRICHKASKRRRWIARIPEYPLLPFRRKTGVSYLRSKAELQLLVEALPVDRADWTMLCVYTAQHEDDVERMQAYVHADPVGGWMVVRNKKNKKPDMRVVMPEPLRNHLRELFRRRCLRPGDKIVKLWRENSRTQQLTRRARKLGLLTPMNATALRHTFATWVVAAYGYIPFELAKWLGHSSMQMLETTYAHALAPGLAGVAGAVERGSAQFLTGGNQAAGQEKTPAGVISTDRGSEPDQGPQEL